MKGRFLDLTLGDPYSNVALEEALLRGAAVPTLRVWKNQKCVVIGRGQMAEFETDLKYCGDKEIPVVRRVTAGGTVYNGPGNLNWTFCVQNGYRDFRGSFDAKGVFRTFASMVVGALASCGVEASYMPPNSISSGGGKVCGMAAYVSREATICHGTLLVNADLREVQRLTRPRDVAIEKKYPRSQHVGVSNCEVGEEKFVDALSSSMDGFEGGELNEKERGLVLELDGKYRSDRWNLGDPFDWGQ